MFANVPDFPTLPARVNLSPDSPTQMFRHSFLTQKHVVKNSVVNKEWFSRGPDSRTGSGSYPQTRPATYGIDKFLVYRIRQLHVIFKHFWIFPSKYVCKDEVKPFCRKNLKQFQISCRKSLDPDPDPV